MVETGTKLTEEYWDEILEEVIEEKKEPMFTNEIWEKMKDDHGYPENKMSLEIKLFNLLREGYIKSVLRMKKQAWMLPSGEEMVSLTEMKVIDATIASYFERILRIPSHEEVKTETAKNPRVSGDDQLINQRLRQASHLLNDVDSAIKEFIKRERVKHKDTKTIQPSDEVIFEEIGESIDQFDVSIIMRFIRTQKKRYSTE